MSAIFNEEDPGIIMSNSTYQAVRFNVPVKGIVKNNLIRHVGGRHYGYAGKLTTPRGIVIAMQVEVRAKY